LRSTTSNNGDDLERVLRENVELRRQVVAEFAKAVEPVTFSHKILTMKTDVSGLVDRALREV
jgi:hypothetical protein